MDDEFILVADRTDEVILSTRTRGEAITAALMIRRAGGEVTLFRAAKPDEVIETFPTTTEDNT